MKYVFIGYPYCVNGYKLWNMEPGRLKFIISRDIGFDGSRIRMKYK